MQSVEFFAVRSLLFTVGSKKFDSESHIRVNAQLHLGSISEIADEAFLLLFFGLIAEKAVRPNLTPRQFAAGQVIDQ